MRGAVWQFGVLWALAIGAGLASCAAAETRAEAEQRTKLAVPRIVGKHPNGTLSKLTGVCIWSDATTAIVLTNAHLFREQVTSIEVQFPAAESLPAQLLFAELHGLTDLAVLQVDTPRQMPAIPLAAADAGVGEPVFLLGYPHGQDNQDIRHGVLRPHRSPEPLAVYSFPTEQGHSGSPILNQHLQLVALNWGGNGEGHGMPVSHVVACCKSRARQFPILQRIFGGGPFARPPAVGSRQMPAGQPGGANSCSPAYPPPQAHPGQTWQTVTGPTAPVVAPPPAQTAPQPQPPANLVPSQPPAQAPPIQPPPQVILPERPEPDRPQTNLAPPANTPPAKSEPQAVPPIAIEATDAAASHEGYPWWLMPYVLTAAGTAAGVGVPAWLVWGVRGASTVGRVRGELRRRQAGTHPPHPGTHATRGPAPTPQHVCPRTGVVAIENPPPPQQVLTETQYVSYEVNSHAEAYRWAKRKLVEKHPGASDQMRVLDSLIRQYLAAQNPKELD